MVSSIHDFEMKEPIGKGSFGTVFRVVRKKDRQEFAMKALKCRDEESFNKCLSEVSKMVVHPNLVECKDCVVRESTSCSYEFYILMPLYDGTLKHYCDSGPLDDAMLLRLLLHIGRALAFLHDHKSCVHRDVKPGNILYRGKDTPTFILGDFGLAKEVICETAPFYMPRKRLEEGYGKEVDMYALGMTAYRARTSVEDLKELSAMLDEGSVSVRSKVEGALGDELGGLVLGLLADRPTPASTLVVVVEDLMSEPPSPHAGTISCPYCGASQTQRGKPMNSTTVNMHMVKCGNRPGSPAGEAKVSPSRAVTTESPENGDVRLTPPKSSTGGGGKACPYCEATTNQKGTPFRSLSKHIQMCPKRPSP